MAKNIYKKLSLCKKEELRKATCLLRFRKEVPNFGDTTYYTYK